MPVPTGWASTVGSAIDAGLIIAPAAPENTAGSVASGLARCSSTVCGSTATTSAMRARSAFELDPSSVWDRSMLAFTAAASNGVPSWNVTSSRRSNVSVVPSGEYSQAVARPGTSEPSGAVWTRRSNTSASWVMAYPLDCLAGSHG